MNHFRTLTLAIGLAALLPCFSQAAPVTFSGDFNASNFPAALTPDPFQGSWSFDFDLSELDPAGGVQRFIDIPLTFFEPVTVGSTLYDETNSFSAITFIPSDNSFLVSLYGEPIGPSTGLTDIVDDFSVTYATDGGIPSISSIGSVSSAIMTNQGVNTNLSQATASDVSGSFTVIPEPSSLALLGIGGLAVIVGLRRTRQVH